MADQASRPAALAPSAPAASISSESQSAFFSQRSRRQLGLFAAGASFFLLSSVITRRSIVRRKAMSVPLFFHHSNYSNPNINGALEAFEALTLATMNVFSYGIMATGGFIWAFDIATIDDMKKKVRVDLNVKASQIDRDAEEEIEELFASVLDRKEFKALRGEKGIKTKEEKEQEAKEQDQKRPKP
ncbi:hypothetical protein VTL71DRAFT_3083 [Oculimacula yallundae]|uniref:Altered inheritance of mitochondria protein 11 n=1 Tax=Oculimacula yallundae TaxID=86028 RepID=A0ABR4C655_9HELO